MRKPAKQVANELIRDLGPSVPVAWVLTCFDLGCAWVFERPLLGIVTFIVAIVVVTFLHGVGVLVLTGENPKNTEPDGNPDWTLLNRLIRLLGLLVVLLLITVRIAS